MKAIETIIDSGHGVGLIFDAQEDAYLYDRAEEHRHTWIPGRPIMHLVKADASQAEFEALIIRLVK